jgi:sugar phosphate isomerase/epimerase
MLSRRRFLAGASTLVPTSLLARAAPAGRRSKQMMLGFGTYGTKGLSTEDAVTLIADTGYDAIELTVNRGWDAEPDNMPAARRKAIRKQIAGRGLELTSLMESVNPSPDAAKGQANLDRLAASMQLARDLAPQHPPQVQTVLGGGNWEERKNMFVDRLGAWLELADQYRVIAAIKPHRGGAMSRPAEAVWIFEQLGKPARLRMVYDFSHYIYRDMEMVPTIRQAAIYTNQVVVKDTVRTESGGTTFKLPGEARTIDYPLLLRTFHLQGYRGDVSCEVSSAVWNKPGYDPRAAVQTCFANMSAAFRDAGLKRR